MSEEKNFSARPAKDSSNGETKPSVEQESSGASTSETIGERVRRDDQALRAQFTKEPLVGEEAKSLYWHGQEPTVRMASPQIPAWDQLAPKCPRCESAMKRTNVHEDPEPGWVCTRAACGAMVLDKGSDKSRTAIGRQTSSGVEAKFTVRVPDACECSFPVPLPMEDGSALCAKCNKTFFRQTRTRKTIHTYDSTFDRYSSVSIESSEPVEVSGKHVTIGLVNPTLLKWPSNFQIKLEESGSHRPLSEIHIDPVEELLKAINICRGPAWAKECRAIWDQVKKAMREREERTQAEAMAAKEVEAKRVELLTQVTKGILSQSKPKQVLSFQCSKCGSTSAKVDWHGPAGCDPHSRIRTLGEHLHATCSNCGFEWTRATLDQSARGEPDQEAQR